MFATSNQSGSKVAKTDVPILLTGETGTGKEVFAHAIHTASARSQYPIVEINCSAFSKDLLESELFGYKAGAFTGAVKDKKGLLKSPIMVPYSWTKLERWPLICKPVCCAF